jgi:hypothetical protein
MPSQAEREHHIQKCIEDVSENHDLLQSREDFLEDIAHDYGDRCEQLRIAHEEILARFKAVN